MAVWSVTNLRSKEIQDGGGRHPNDLNITISGQWFDRSAQHLGMMTHIGPLNQACYSRKFIRQFMCINFADTNSYARKAIHKTFLRTKNRKFVHKYTHDLSCRTTENFLKDSELMK